MFIRLYIEKYSTYEKTCKNLFLFRKNTKTYFTFQKKIVFFEGVLFIKMSSTFGQIYTLKIRVLEVKIHGKNLGGSIEIRGSQWPLWLQHYKVIFPLSFNKGKGFL